MSKNKGIMGFFTAPTAGDAINGNLLTYDWRMEGIPSEFGVDLSLLDYKLIGSHPVLAILECAASGSISTPLPQTAVGKAVRLVRKCSRELDALIVGYVQTVFSLKYYIYLSSFSDYESMKSFSGYHSGSGFDFHLEARSDADWDTYFNVLYPDDAKKETVENGKTINMLYRNGDSEMPRRINLHLAFPTDSDRAAFASSALDEGFAIGNLIEDSNFEKTCPYEIVVHRICALKKWDIDTLTVQAIRVAEKRRGKLLWWDCPIVPRKAQL